VSEDDKSRGPGRLLKTRGQKVAAIVGGAFLATIGGVIATRVIAFGETTTQKVLGSSAPLSVRVLPRGTYEESSAIGSYYIVPRAHLSGPDALSKSDLDGWQNEATRLAWARDHAAVDGSTQLIMLELRSKSDEPVTVTAIKVRDLRREPPAHGWYVAFPIGCGVAQVRLANVDLDAPSPRFEYFENDASPKTDRLVLTVTRTDAELVQMSATTRDALVEWRAEIFYSSPDGQGSIVVGDGGKPFRVSTELGSDGYRYDFANRRAVREPAWDRGISAC
jgi:hypothetical protein